MLKLAIEAELPLIAVTTRDTLNLPEVLKEITGKVPLPYTPGNPLGKGQLYYLIQKPKPAPQADLSGLYFKLVKTESTLLVVNGSPDADGLFHAGEIPVPRSLLKTFLMEVTEDEKKADLLIRALGGVTIKETAELVRLTMARDQSLTADGVMATRKQAFHEANGLTQVDVKQSFYAPHSELVEWALAEKPFFLNGNDPRLIPRGLMFDGPPGTGKTAGAKWLAETWGIPLYRVDVGGTKAKWMGESEANMLNNLGRLDHEEPCIALFDEVEKIFGDDHDSSGTTTTMLSQLLWWLAEHKSKVLVIMTTNASKKLPKELYREGRIDQVMWFGGLDCSTPATEFVEAIKKTFKGMDLKGIKPNAVVASAHKLGTNPETVSPAALTTAVYKAIKASLN